MKSIGSVAVAIALVLAASVPSGLYADEGPTAAQIEGNRIAAELGEQIWLHDQAAWHGTDALFAAIKPEDHPELRGYLTEAGKDGAIDLIFYAERDGRSYEFARYVVKDSKVIGGAINARILEIPLSPMLERKLAARNVALAAVGKERRPLCTNAHPNTVVLDPDANGIIPVYILSAQTATDTYPLGGHYLYRVDASGNIVSDRQFMKTCLNMPTGSEQVNGEVPISFFVTHILDDHPTEIHHFVKRYSDLPLQVSAGDQMWEIE